MIYCTFFPSIAHSLSLSHVFIIQRDRASSARCLLSLACNFTYVLVVHIARSFFSVCQYAFELIVYVHITYLIDLYFILCSSSFPALFRMNMYIVYMTLIKEEKN